MCSLCCSCSHCNCRRHRRRSRSRRRCTGAHRLQRARTPPTRGPAERRPRPLRSSQPGTHTPVCVLRGLINKAHTVTRMHIVLGASLHGRTHAHKHGVHTCLPLGSSTARQGPEGTSEFRGKSNRHSLQSRSAAAVGNGGLTGRKRIWCVMFATCVCMCVFCACAHMLSVHAAIR